MCLFKSHLKSGAFVRPENSVRLTEVNKFVEFSLEPLHCKDPSPPLRLKGQLYRYVQSANLCPMMCLAPHINWFCIHSILYLIATHVLSLLQEDRKKRREDEREDLEVSENDNFFIITCT